MDMRIPPLQAMLESNPLKSRILVLRLAVASFGLEAHSQSLKPGIEAIGLRSRALELRESSVLGNDYSALRIHGTRQKDLRFA